MTSTLHIISGPTAVGKTAYALDFAEAHDAEIVSCDASLFYQGMDIGTAKPSADELSRIPHHLIDLCAPNEPFDIVAFDSRARAVIAELQERGKGIVVTGGSGFYLKSFFAPVIDTVVVSDSIREEVECLWAAEGLSGLLKELRRLSPEGLGNLDVMNPRRVSRALERCLASGRSLLELQREFAARPEPYPAFQKQFILLERDPEELKCRIALRAEQMLANGLLEEATLLRQKGIESNPSAASAIGYRETIAYLKGELPREDLLPTIIQNTNRLVKKQRTWFRTQIRSPDQRVRFD